MAGAQFSLADLIPEPLTFRDSGPGGSGEVYTVLTPELFSPEDYAEFARLQEEIRLLLSDRNPAEAAQASDLDRYTSRIMGILVPDLPEARRKKISIAFRLRFLGWWKDQQPEPGAVLGNAVRATSPTRRKRSPASSSSTAYRRGR